MGQHSLSAPASSLSTQEKNPRSAVLRTVVAAAVAIFPILNIALGITIDMLEPYRVYLPGWVFIALNGSLVAVTLIAAWVTRIMAIPGLNDWFRKYLPILSPEDKTPAA